MIKHEDTAQTALTTDVFLALEQLQEVVDEKRDVVMGCAPYTAILWRDGELHYKSYFDPDEMTWTDGLLIGIIANTVLTAGSDRYSPDHPGMKWARTFQVAGIRECLGHTRDSHSQAQPCGRVWACKLPLVEHPRLGVPDRY